MKPHTVRDRRRQSWRTASKVHVPYYGVELGRWRWHQYEVDPMLILFLSLHADERRIDVPGKCLRVLTMALHADSVLAVGLESSNAELRRSASINLVLFLVILTALGHCLNVNFGGNTLPVYACEFAEGTVNSLVVL